MRRFFFAALLLVAVLGVAAYLNRGTLLLRLPGWLDRARCFRDVHATLGHVMLGRGILEDAGRVRVGLRAQSPLF